MKIICNFCKKAFDKKIKKAHSMGIEVNHTPCNGVQQKENTMKYIIGASFMLLAISIAFNIYFASHVEMRVVLPQEIEAIDLK